jgi:hypothetical protein
LTHFFVGKSLQIGQPQGLDFIVGQGHFFQLPQGNALGLEVHRVGAVSNASGLAGSGHENLPWFSFGCDL